MGGFEESKARQGMSLVEYLMSKDGTRIGFQRRGEGPGLVLIQGAMATAYNYTKLAEALQENFTVITPDRRGRGMSQKPYEATHSIDCDIDDLDALLSATGAHFVFGLSSGAVITLEATRRLTKITRAAVYEPPFYAHGISHDGIRQLNNEIERGDLASALGSALLVAETAPAFLRVLPSTIRWLLASVVLRVDDRWHVSGGESLRDLVPSVRYDFNVVGGMDGKMDTLASIKQPLLLLTGRRSPAFLHEATDRLGATIRSSHHIELHGLDHSGPWNNGQPKVVAKALQEFFLPAAAS